MVQTEAEERSKNDNIIASLDNDYFIQSDCRVSGILLDVFKKYSRLNDRSPDEVDVLIDRAHYQTRQSEVIS